MDDIDKVRDDLQSTKQMLALELRNKEAQIRENKRLLAKIQNLEAELEKERNRTKDSSVRPATRPTKKSSTRSNQKPNRPERLPRNSRRNSRTHRKNWTPQNPTWTRPRSRTNCWKRNCKKRSRATPAR